MSSTRKKHVRKSALKGRTWALPRAACLAEKKVQPTVVDMLSHVCLLCANASVNGTSDTRSRIIAGRAQLQTPASTEAQFKKGLAATPLPPWEAVRAVVLSKTKVHTYKRLPRSSPRLLRLRTFQGGGKMNVGRRRGRKYNVEEEWVNLA